ncbi:MAG: hypothetical protein ACI9BV_003693 [Rhodothermales bacterium]
MNGPRPQLKSAWFELSANNVAAFKKRRSMYPSSSGAVGAYRVGSLRFKPAEGGV